MHEKHRDGVKKVQSDTIAFAKYKKQTKYQKWSTIPRRRCFETFSFSSVSSAFTKKQKKQQKHSLVFVVNVCCSHSCATSLNSQSVGEFSTTCTQKHSVLGGSHTRRVIFHRVHTLDIHTRRRTRLIAHVFVHIYLQWRHCLRYL